LTNNIAENLFSESASRERKFWGFLVFQKMLKDGTHPTLLENLFSPNLMRCIINQLSKEDRFLHRAADKTLKVLLQTIEENSSAAIEILPRLISDNGVYNFDQVTKTKTVDKILNTISGSAAIFVVNHLSQEIQTIQK
jgi:DNA polymerase phi